MHSLPQARRSQHLRIRSKRSGMTLVELTVSMTVLIVAVGGAMASVSSFAALGEAAKEKSAALLEAQRVIERMQATEFENVLAVFNDTNADDPAGIECFAHFDVGGLRPRAGDNDGQVGRILLPVDAGTPDQLYEDRVDDEFGFPRDLNVDGVIDALDHAGDYAVLPVRVVVEWTGNSGNRSITLETTLRRQG